MKKMTMIPIFVIILAVLALSPVAAREKEAIFGGGCFWCLEPPFESLRSMSEVISGYTGGHVENPSYQQVTQGNTGHYEAVRVVYNDDVISYEELLEVFWRNITRIITENNPTDIMHMRKGPDAKDFWQIFGKTRSGPCTINLQIVN